VKEIVKHQNIDKLITNHDKKVFSSGKLKAIQNSDRYIQKRDCFIFNKKVNGYHVWMKGYNNEIT
ncbi:sensor histidine kinase, partial [Staphylococcus sp. KY49P]|nr:sensor histidine kinase [Staphylococcus sp. KY49P]